MNPPNSPIAAAAEPGQKKPRPRHFAYETPDGTVLKQGDLLQRTPALNKVLEECHLYFVKPQYKYFLVLTQSCSLVRRDEESSASHIVIAAVRSIDDAITREAKKYQKWWHEGLNIISDERFNKFREFVERLIDNSEPSYFYLPEDAALELNDDHCAFLRVAISLKRMHYGVCLDAKIAECSEAFRAKLGWLVGTLYNQVGTTEWDEKYGPGKRSKLASRLITGVVHVVADERITETVRELAASGKELRQVPLEDIEAVLENKRVVPPKVRFKEAAKVAVERIKFIDRICSHGHQQVKDNPEVIEELKKSLQERNIEVPENADEVIGHAWKYLLGAVLRDESFAARDKVIDYLVASLVTDPAIDRLISGD